MLKACDIGLISLHVEPAASNPAPAFKRVRARAYGLGLDRSPAGLNQSIKLYYYSLWAKCTLRDAYVEALVRPQNSVIITGVLASGSSMELRHC